MLYAKIIAAIVAAFALFAAPAYAAARDCPLRDAGYSVDLPLIELLLKPEALALIDTDAPGAMEKIPARWRRTEAPSFASIITFRGMARRMEMTPETMAAIEASLRALPITAADRTRRCARYDSERPALDIPRQGPRILVFEKITGYRDGPSVEAGRAAFTEIAQRRGWGLVVTEHGGVMRPDILRRFDVVVWNNVSGDVLTRSQRRAFQRYIEQGGGFIAVHGSGGDPVYIWDWYADTLIGARFRGHTEHPQFQTARVQIEQSASGIGASLAPGWTMTDEWYSFRTNPRASGASIIATLDETTFGADDPPELRMGADHPIAWTKCLGRGRAFFSAIGHMPATYTDPNHVRLLEDALAWTMGQGATRCERGREVAR